MDMESRQTAERKGIMIGILILVLIALGVYFYWRHMEVRGADAPAVQESSRR